MSLQEVIGKTKNFDALSQAEKIKMFGWYLHVKEKKPRFDTSALRICYRNLHLKDPSSFSPFFKSLETQKALHKDREGYYLDRKVMETLNSRYANALPTAPVSQLLMALPARLTDSGDRGFIEEAITCISANASRAAIVLGWCAVIDRMRRRIEAAGIQQFNAASLKMKSSAGKYKYWNKGPQLSSASELTSVFDSDLIIVLIGMELIDSNQAARLDVLFKWRCDSAHPSEAPIGPAHVVSFFTDAVDLVLANPTFALA